MPSSLIRLLSIALLLLLGGCISRGIPLAGSNGEQPAARALLQQSAEAHGLAAFRRIDDISAAYAGEWYGLVAKIQPTLIDADFRQGSQERIIFKNGPVLGQRHLGPKGSKQVIRRNNDVQVFYNNAPASDRDVLAAAALVADGYRMFLTGPFYFLDGNLSLEMGEDEVVEGRPCVTLVAVRRPRAVGGRSLPAFHRPRQASPAPRPFHDGRVGVNPRGCRRGRLLRSQGNCRSHLANPLLRTSAQAHSEFAGARLAADRAGRQSRAD